MKSTSNTKTNEIGIISFDDTLLFNYRGLSKIGLDKSNLNNIHHQLLRYHNYGSAPDAHFFIDRVLSVERETWKFIKNEIEPTPSLEFKAIWDTLSQILDERHYRKNLKKHPVTDYRFCGFFTLRAVNSDIEPEKQGYMRLYSPGLSYINNAILPHMFYCYVSEKDFDLNESYHLPKDRDLSKQPFQQRIEGEVFFEKDILLWLLNRHYRTEKIDFDSIKPDLIYKNGKKLTPRLVPNTHKEKELSDLTRDTYTRIIAGLFEILKNSNRPKFKDDKAIYNHLKKHFLGVKGLTENTINKFMAASKSDLDDRQRQVGDRLTYSEKIKS